MSADDAIDHLRALLKEQTARADKAEHAHAAEHRRRCDIEHRFDVRLAGVGVADEAHRWSQIAEVPPAARDAIAKLILWAQALRGEMERGPRGDVDLLVAAENLLAVLDSHDGVREITTETAALRAAIGAAR